jgi:hypothetical protein
MVIFWEEKLADCDGGNKSRSSSETILSFFIFMSMLHSGA